MGDPPPRFLAGLGKPRVSWGRVGGGTIGRPRTCSPATRGRPIRRRRRASLTRWCTNSPSTVEIEELRFYPRLREVLDDGDRLADEAVHEHVEIKVTLNGIDSMTAEDPGFDDRMRELMAEVRHHVEEEGRDLFPGIRSAGN